MQINGDSKPVRNVAATYLSRSWNRFGFWFEQSEIAKAPHYFLTRKLTPQRCLASRWCSRVLPWLVPPRKERRGRRILKADKLPEGSATECQPPAFSLAGLARLWPVSFLVKGLKHEVFLSTLRQRGTWAHCAYYLRPPHVVLNIALKTLWIVVTEWHRIEREARGNE